MFKPVSRTTLGDDVLKQFIDLLASSKYKPGERLPSERRLCEMLQISRPALREVIRALCYLGYLESVQGGGTYVSKMPLSASMSAMKIRLALEKNKLLEIWELRYILEVEVAGLAAERATPTDIQALQVAFLEFEKAVLDNDSGARLVETTKTFHNLIARSVKNHLLMELLEGISDLLSLSREKTKQVTGSRERALEYNRAILEAIAKGIPEAAKEQMRKHLLDVKNDILHYLVETG